MKFKLLYFSIFTVLICAIFASSCSSTKFVPDGEYLLTDTDVKVVDTKGFSSMEMESYVKQRPNFRTLMLFKLPLTIYNLSGYDSTRWINRTLRNAGEPPVIFDSLQIDNSVKNITRIMNNKGYLDAKVEPEVTLKKKKAKIAYNVFANRPYTISDYLITVNDSLLDTAIVPTDQFIPTKKTPNVPQTKAVLSQNPIISKGNNFDLARLDEERNRITNIFRKVGYYNFDKEHVGFIADTAVGNNQIDLELKIYPFATRGIGGQIVEGKHQRYYINKVSIYVDFDPLVGIGVDDYESSSIYEDGNIHILYGKRGKYIYPKEIIENCYILPGELYNEEKTSRTYSAFSKLFILKNVNISYVPIVENDSTKLNCIITCVPDKKQGISAEVEGTNSGGFFGVESSLGYTHRNAFKRAEQFNFKLRGAYEALTSSFSNFDNNYFEIGGETSLTIPRFIIPFLSRDFKRSIHASTEFSASYTYQRRPDYFTRTVSSVGMKYIWQGQRANSARHTVELFDINYIHLPGKLGAAFDSTLTINARLYSFTDQFIMSSGYTYSKANITNTTQKYGTPISSIRTSIETAGNALSLIAKLADIKREDGSKKIFGTRYAQYVRGTVDYSQTLHIDEKNSFAWRIGGGVAYPYGNFKEIPIQKRFFAGGANSVRGWGVRELGPGSFKPKNKDYNNFYYHSGDIRLDASMEYRSKVFWVLELAAFVDAGNIWTFSEYENQERGNFQFDRFYKEIALAWGLGLRFDFDFVMIRLDCGWKAYDPSESKMSDRWKIKSPQKIGSNTAWHIAVGYPF